MKILVSSCLLGYNCKYNGGNNLSPKVVDYLKDKEIMEICPEIMAGMGTPRACAEMVEGKIRDENGADVDALYRKGVALALRAIKDEEIDFAILQSRSPTCGVRTIYDGSFTGKLIAGQGLFAQALRDAGYRVMDAGDF
ncbi:uncharacterized protein YbbK (DUF523 family) [Desulfitobacterium sp. LBE]|uniref:DUF523 domain-containing protein n=1 Tax=Desulfitobacterium sp. LBE TaxID=884086 RepID=UPI00119BDED1|nr:DUF523 domain-containing protein [Desulfitobacterium sp. LBE]TWH57517.1 uncharacterized protein YbbK (DUF523 family) [Desulfitobacterium sp. LBE]